MEHAVIQTFLKRSIFFFSKNLTSINGNVDLRFTEGTNTLGPINVLNVFQYLLLLC